MNDVTPAARLVVSVYGEPPPRAILDVAAEIAKLLSARFSALMIEDEAAASLGSIPFAREYVAGRSVWQNIGSEDVRLRREGAVRRAQSLLVEVAALHGLGDEFEWLQTQARAPLAAALAKADIVAFAAPANMLEWVVLPYSELAETAMRGHSPALVLPSRMARRSGPVVALVGPDDEDVAGVAARIARAAGEQLILFVAGMNEPGRQTGQFVSHIDLPRGRLRIVDIGADSAGALARLHGELGERIAVVARSAISPREMQRLLQVSASRGVPVLVAGEAAKAAP